ncbi:hypothetical protein AB5I41_31725 [Sphingomonas sp. MMS24-JH45]
MEQEIAMAVYGAEASDVTGITVIDGHIWRVPAYTASLDAAMTLIPKPGKWSITASHGEGWEAGSGLPRGERPTGIVPPPPPSRSPQLV